MAKKKKEENGFKEYKKLFMYQFSEHSKAIGGLTQEIRNLRDDVVAIKVETKIEAKEESKKESLKTRLLSVLFAGTISALIAILV